jgi:hypothetical protein
VAVGSVKPAVATLDLRDFCAESEEESKEETKEVTKQSRLKERLFTNIDLKARRVVEWQDELRDA